MQKIPSSYQKILSKETEKQYFKDIVSFLNSEKKA
jgi:uracil DNA glycosylase